MPALVRCLRTMIAALILLAAAPVIADDAKPAAKPAEAVSFYRQVRPILQRNCAGCHQPAKDSGKLLLTSYDGLKKGRENGPGFVAGKPDESNMIEYVSGDKP